MELVAYNEADGTAEWKLADVRSNRSGTIVFAELYDKAQIAGFG